MGPIRSSIAAAAAVGRAALRPETYAAQARDVACALVEVGLYPLGLAEGALDATVDRLVPDPAAGRIDTPVVLVHGYGSIKSHWLALHVALRRAGFAHVEALNYNPLTADIPTIAGRLCDLVADVRSRTGAARFHLIGHSMGGVVIRHAVEVDGLGAAGAVATAITVASPHGGSPFAHLADWGVRLGVTRAAAQMRPGAGLLARIESAAAANAASHAHDVAWIAFYSNVDVVVPARSAMLRTPGATNLLVKDEGHVGVLLSGRLIGAVRDQLLAAEGVAVAPIVGLPAPIGAGSPSADAL